MSTRVLITGAGSYIGEKAKTYLTEKYGYQIDTIPTQNYEPKKENFIGYDVVYNVAGIAHIKETDENRQLYYAVNRDLVVKIAECAKAAGVKQFVMLSTMSVYGKTIGHITKQTKEDPQNAYGKSKLEADHLISKLADENFRVAILRPPMIYGKDCKGNYQSLRKFALKSPIFPDYTNKRSMLFVDNLSEFVHQAITNQMEGIFFPQNKEYVNTKEMVEAIAKIHGKKIWFTKVFNLVIKHIQKGIVSKVFGDLTYEKVDLVDCYSFQETIDKTEN